MFRFVDVLPTEYSWRIALEIYIEQALVFLFSVLVGLLLLFLTVLVGSWVYKSLSLILVLILVTIIVLKLTFTVKNTDYLYSKNNESSPRVAGKLAGRPADNGVKEDKDNEQQ